MNAMKKLAKHLRKNQDAESTRILDELVVALDSGGSFSVDDLYRLGQDEFDLALEVMKQWRFRRHMQIPFREQLDAAFSN